MISDIIESKTHDCRYAYTIENLVGEHCLTFGTGSYAIGIFMTVYPEEKRASHLLLGRFSSLADKINFLTSGKHNYKNVSSFPFDSKVAVEKIFGDVEPLPNVRTNHFQVVVGHDVWIAQGATILGGVKIASGAVIGAGAVVAKDVPPYAIVVGNPARVLKYRFDEATIKKLFAVKWWNWDLQKIADNLPLMNDVEKFLSRHWSPELEQIPEDEIGLQVESFRAQGFKVYNFVADFRSPKPLWLRVVSGFCQSNFANSKLVIWLDKNSSDADFDSLATFAQTFGLDAIKNILLVDGDGKFSPHALRSATHLITNREMSSLECLDWLWNTDVKIVSALDERIFDGEPPVDWTNVWRSVT